jgi:hypothetical protein
MLRALAMKTSVLTSLLTVALAAGCSTYDVASARTPPTDAFGPPPTGLARVCVFRPHRLGAALTTPMRDNGRLVGATQGPGYFCYFAAPGNHELRVEVSDASPIRFSVESGGRYFVHHEINVGSDELLFVNEREARALAAACEYQVVVGVPSDEHLPLSVPLARAQ